MEILSEFISQLIKLVFYLVILVGAVNLGIFFRKRKNIKDAVNEHKND